MGPREPGNSPKQRSDLRKGVSPSEATDKNTEKMQVSSHTYKGIPLPNDISDLIRSQKIKLVLFFLYSFAQGIYCTRESTLSGLTHSQSSHLKTSCACFHIPDFPPELHPVSLGSHSSTAPCLARAARGPASIQESQQPRATVSLYPVVDSVTANTPRGSSAGTQPPALVV